jgi:choline dehydrogenase-like flavoprotein
VTGEIDDLARFMPVHEHLLPPLRLDAASRSLLDAYGRKRTLLNSKRVFVGRTRVATLSQQHGDREPCSHLGRCLWGCPNQSLYTPSITLAQLQKHQSFRYLPGRLVQRLTLHEGGHASSIVCRRIADNVEEQLPVDRVVLAAGTLGSATIMLRTLQDATGAAIRLNGLMDNRQVLVPFVQLRRLGQRRELAEYQYHLVGMAILGKDPTDFVHCQVTTLKSALLHPILQRLPFDLRTSAAIGRLTTAALGVVNVNFADSRRRDCEAWLENDRLRLRYVAPPDESLRIASSLARVRRALRELGCVVPPGVQHVRPMGASAHYTGLFPMATNPTKYASAPDGRSWDVPNVYFADGSTFPALPAKNLTFTLMANATRIANEAF